MHIYILESSAALRAALILRGNRNRRGNRGEIVGQAGREWQADGCGSAWGRTALPKNRDDRSQLFVSRAHIPRIMHFL